ncbi:hypothetical protein Ctob_007257 [Chrysochromulina tobinii]|uniref:Uncharacterized protein n=1 Tax=Chrysochromulina tobinii TaxID=1460289 RepID=A0A0M0JBC5_9EUKA|nr:hypothetical protein Ctob_007257 [Chrysochromulina tobinii]|eukprot:KOO23876.1 hypothetical protein Ctob_007257 [Chrysochromulina sp. CCMP291]
MGRPGTASSVAKTGTSATLQSVQRLPTLENLSIQDVELSAGVVDDVSLEVVLNKSGWKEPARQMLPVRYLRAGLQDLTFRVPRLGQADEAKAKAEEAREAVRKKEEARQQRQREIEEARQAEEEILREQQRKKELRLEAEKRAAEIERNKAEAKAAEEEILREQQQPRASQ